MGAVVWSQEMKPSLEKIHCADEQKVIPGFLLGVMKSG